MQVDGWPELHHKIVALDTQKFLGLTDSELEEIRLLDWEYEDGVDERTRMDEYDQDFLQKVRELTTKTLRVRSAFIVFFKGIWSTDDVWRDTLEATANFFKLQ